MVGMVVAAVLLLLTISAVAVGTVENEGFFLAVAAVLLTFALVISLSTHYEFDVRDDLNDFDVVGVPLLGPSEVLIDTTNGVMRCSIEKSADDKWVIPRVKSCRQEPGVSYPTGITPEDLDNTNNK